MQQKMNQWWGSVENAAGNLGNAAGNFKPGIYQGQTAMYGTAGSFDWRFRSQDYSLGIDFQPPSISGGCGGINAYLGGFSAIDSGEFIQSLTEIASNASSLMFMLALQVVSPMLSEVVEDIRKFAQDYLNLDFNSCNAAKGLVGGAFAMGSADIDNCAQEMVDRGEASDYREASYACTSKTATGVLSNKSAFTSGNIFWYAVMQEPEGIFAQNAQFAEVIMNLVGTVVFQPTKLNDGEEGWEDNPDLEPPKYDLDKQKIVKIIYGEIIADGLSQSGQAIFDVLLNGSAKALTAYPGEQILGCADVGSGMSEGNPEFCTELVYEDLAGLDTLGLVFEANQMLNSIMDKIYEEDENNPLTSMEKWMIQSARIPLFKYITVAAAAFPYGTGEDLDAMSRELVEDYAVILAKDIIINGMVDALEQVLRHTGNLPNGISSTAEVRAYRAVVEAKMGGLQKLEEKHSLSADKYFQFHEKMRQYERLVLSRMAQSVSSAAMWGG